jgi:cytochrome P450
MTLPRAMLYDESVYPEPHIFNPDRWLKDGELDPDVPYPAVAFGFGR